MTDVEKKLQIKAPIEKVWAALTDPVRIGAWMDDDSVQVDLAIDGRYVFFGGETTGAFTRIDAPRHLEYTWRQAGWSKTWQDSLVKWTLRKSGNETLLSLVHTQFPNEQESIDHNEGWDEYWLQPMRAWLEA